MESIFITGANRGIGLELVRQYLQRDQTRVFAAARQPDQAEALQALVRGAGERLVLIPLEVTDDAQRQQAVARVSAHTDRLDVLINNAAINPPGRTQTLEHIEAAAFLQVLHVNTVAPLLIAQAFSGLLENAPRPRLVNLSSEMGSLTERTYGGDYAYCTSKAALNMVTRGLAADLRRYKIISIALDPGWVQTDMGGSGATLTPTESVRGITRVIDGLSSKDNGSYLRWDGSRLPW